MSKDYETETVEGKEVIIQSSIRPNKLKEAKVKSLLVLMIVETLDFLSVGKSMGASQINTTADLILENMSIYKPDYFALCFKNAKMGAYGKQYDRMDGQIIFEWLNQFNKDYCAEIEQARIDETKRLNAKPIGIPDPVTAEPKGVPMPEYFKETITALGKKESVLKPFEVSEEQKLINAYMKEFNAIHDEQGLSDGKRFIKYEDRIIDVAEYIEIRIKQY